MRKVELDLVVGDVLCYEKDLSPNGACDRENRISVVEVGLGLVLLTDFSRGTYTKDILSVKKEMVLYRCQRTQSYMEQIVEGETILRSKTNDALGILIEDICAGTEDKLLISGLNMSTGTTVFIEPKNTWRYFDIDNSLKKEQFSSVKDNIYSEGDLIIVKDNQECYCEYTDLFEFYDFPNKEINQCEIGAVCVVDEVCIDDDPDTHIVIATVINTNKRIAISKDGIRKLVV